jgi:hypothetical protein
VVDQVDRARLVDEALPDVAAVRVDRVQDLDGDLALDGLVQRLIDLSHPSFPELSDKAVGPDHGVQRYHRQPRIFDGSVEGCK